MAQGNQGIIFLVEEDNETRPLLKDNLQRYGYRVIVALNEEDALERVEAGHIQADLVLINLVGETPEEILHIGRRIREHAKYNGHTPLIVLAEKYGADLEGTNVNVSNNDWIIYPEEAEQLEHLLARLISRLPT